MTQKAPKPMRQAGTMAGLGFMAALGLVAGIVFMVIPAHNQTDREARNALSLGGAAVFLGFLAATWYAWGFVAVLTPTELSIRKRFPFRSRRMPWASMTRVDYFVQRRRLGVGGVAATYGVSIGRIRGFRFWVGTTSAEFREYPVTPELAAWIFNHCLRSRTDLPARVSVIHGGANSEFVFSVTKVHHAFENVLGFVLGDRGLKLDRQGGHSLVGLEEDNEADLVIVTMEWPKRR